MNQGITRPRSTSGRLRGDECIVFLLWSLVLKDGEGRFTETEAMLHMAWKQHSTTAMCSWSYSYSEKAMTQ
jgi:hypothetical protein